jgi:hypothetical protein
MTDEEQDEWMRELTEPSERMKYERQRPPKKRRGLAAFKLEVIAIALVLLSVGALASFVLFSQNPTYVSIANITSSCPKPAGAAAGSLIIFSCATLAAIHVASAASGSVVYSSFTVPSNITSQYLVDDRIGTAPSCLAWTSAGNDPIQIFTTGGTIPIGTVAGDLHPNHGYFYCLDFASAPLSFNFTVDWTQ